MVGHEDYREGTTLWWAMENYDGPLNAIITYTKILNIVDLEILLDDNL